MGQLIPLLINPSLLRCMNPGPCFGKFSLSCFHYSELPVAIISSFLHLHLLKEKTAAGPSSQAKRKKLWGSFLKNTRRRPRATAVYGCWYSRAKLSALYIDALKDKVQSIPLGWRSSAQYSQPRCFQSSSCHILNMNEKLSVVIYCCLTNHSWIQWLIFYFSCFSTLSGLT